MAYRITARITLIAYVFSFAAPIVSFADAYNPASDPVISAFTKAIKSKIFSVGKGFCPATDAAYKKIQKQIESQRGMQATKAQFQIRLDLRGAQNRCQQIGGDLRAEKEAYFKKMTGLGLSANIDAASIGQSTATNALMLTNGQDAGQGGSKLELENDEMIRISHQVWSEMSNNQYGGGNAPWPNTKDFPPGKIKSTKHNGILQNMANLLDSSKRLKDTAAAQEMNDGYQLLKDIHEAIVTRVDSNYRNIDVLKKLTVKSNATAVGAGALGAQPAAKPAQLTPDNPAASTGDTAGSGLTMGGVNLHSDVGGGGAGTGLCIQPGLGGCLSAGSRLGTAGDFHVASLNELGLPGLPPLDPSTGAPALPVAPPPAVEPPVDVHTGGAPPPPAAAQQPPSPAAGPAPAPVQPVPAPTPAPPVITDRAAVQTGNQPSGLGAFMGAHPILSMLGIAGATYGLIKLFGGSKTKTVTATSTDTNTSTSGVVPGTPSTYSLSMSGSYPATIKAGDTLGDFQVTVNNGGSTANVSIPVTVSCGGPQAPAVSGNCQLSGNLTQTTSGGVASFSGIKVTAASGTVVLLFNAPGAATLTGSNIQAQ